MPGVRHAWLAVPLGIGVLAVAPAIGLETAIAQSLPDGTLLRPELDGSPGNPSRFRKQVRTVDQDPVPYTGYRPTFGNPPASGAGDTGFDSTGKPRRKKLPPGRRAGASTQAPTGTSATLPGATPIASGSESSGPFPTAPTPSTPPPAKAPPPPGTPHITAASTRIGGAMVAGGVPADPTYPVRHLPPPEADPYAPLGLRLGTFVVHSAVELFTGYDTNPSRAPAGSKPSPLFEVAPELHAQSDWSRHALSIDMISSYSWLTNDSTANRPNLDIKANGRIDVSSHDRIDTQARLLLTTEYPGSPNVPFDIVKLPIYTDLGATAGYGHTFNRLDISIKGSIDQFTYQESKLSDGSSFSNADRDYNQYGGELRGSYELNPGLKPFAALDADTRIHDLPVDRTGVDRDSTGVTPRVGAAVDLFGTLKGEMSVGYTMRSYKDPTLSDLRGLVLDGALVWSATPLTTLTLAAQSYVNESVQPDVSGVLTDSVTLQLDHAFRRWLIGTARFGDEIDQYQGSPRIDHRYLASLGLTYKMTRTLQIKGEARHEWLNSNIPGQDYEANVFLLGVRAQN